ncbi:MAG: hypothetical protein NWE91_00470 [Candidatus Bathyarchaeota archaeon]|nr:hypothetical protein [Candidatus Bathyarchaeota archaeon]
MAVNIYDCQSIEDSDCKPTEDVEMSSLAIGSQVQLIFRTQFLTFTADQFSKALKGNGYLVMQSQMANPQGTQAPPIFIQSFSKGDVTVLLPPVQPPNLPIIVFQILNTVNLEPKYEEVKKILIALNIYPEIISDASFKCTTRRKAKTTPLSSLTSMVDTEYIKNISKNFTTELKVASLKFVTSFPLKPGGCQVIIEPLITSAENEYYVEISFMTTKIKQFDKFIGEFGSDMIQRIIEETERNV